MWKAQPSEQMSSGMLSLMKFLSIAEPLGALALLVGFLPRLAALGLSLVMLGAIYMKMNKWQKKFSGDGGWEFEFLILCACLALFFMVTANSGVNTMIFGR